MSAPACPQLVWSITSCEGKIGICAKNQRDVFVLKLCKPLVSACDNNNDEDKARALPGVFVPGDFARLWDLDPEYRAMAVLTFNPDANHPCPCKVRRSVCLTVTGAIAECGTPCAQLTLVGFFASGNDCDIPLGRKQRLADATLTVCGPYVRGVTASCDCLLEADGEKREKRGTTSEE